MPEPLFPEPQTDVFAMLSVTLPGLVVPEGPFHTEAALAADLGIDVRRLREFRRRRLVTPDRVGRGLVYRRDELRSIAVLATLARLGATDADLDHAFAEGSTTPLGAREALHRCLRLFDDLRRRAEDEIERLRGLEALVTDWVDDGFDYRSRRHPA